MAEAEVAATCVALTRARDRRVFTKRSFFCHTFFTCCALAIVMNESQGEDPVP
jgi:hypothetical protein